MRNVLRYSLAVLVLLPLLAACSTREEGRIKFIDFPESERKQRIEQAESEDWPNLKDVPARPAHAMPITETGEDAP